MKNNLAKLRNKKRLTQAKLAEILGTNQKNISAWENGRRTPKYAMMQKIEDFFGEPKEKIFFDVFIYSK